MIYNTGFDTYTKKHLQRVLLDNRIEQLHIE